MAIGAVSQPPGAIAVLLDPHLYCRCAWVSTGPCSAPPTNRCSAVSRMSRPLAGPESVRRRRADRAVDGSAAARRRRHRRRVREAALERGRRRSPRDLGSRRGGTHRDATPCSPATNAHGAETPRHGRYRCAPIAAPGPASSQRRVHPHADGRRLSGHGRWTSPLPVGPARSHLLQRQQSYGRGRTPLDAQPGCIAEALERYSLVYRGDEQIVRARFDEVDAIHPADDLFSDSQYQDREAWNAADELFHVPEPFDADTLSIGSRRSRSPHRHRLVPAACASCGTSSDRASRSSPRRHDRLRQRPTFEERCTDACSNGSNATRSPSGGTTGCGGRDLFRVVRVSGDRCRGERSGARSDREPVPARLHDGHRDSGVRRGRAATRWLRTAYRGSRGPLVAVAAFRAASEVGQVWFERRTERVAAPCSPRGCSGDRRPTNPYLAPTS